MRVLMVLFVTDIFLLFIKHCSNWVEDIFLLSGGFLLFAYTTRKVGMY
jgi:hypothetical protein